jgi:HEAT repeat protein
MIALLLVACSGEPSFEGMTVADWEQVLLGQPPSNWDPLTRLNNGGPDAHAVLAGLLRSSHARVRRDVASYLRVPEKDPGSIVHLLDIAIADADPLVRYPAYFRLGEDSIPVDVAYPRLLAGTLDDFVAIRYAAARELGDLEPATGRTVSALIERMKEDLPGVRYAAAYSLARVGEGQDRAADALIDLLKDGSVGVGLVWTFPETEKVMNLAGSVNLLMLAAATPLGPRVEDPAAFADQAGELLKQPHLVLEGAIRAIRAYGAGVTPKLVAMLKSRNPGQRMAACFALFALGPAAASAGPALEKAVDDQDPSVRLCVGTTLHELTGEAGPGIRVCREILNDAELPVGVRLNAARGLGEIGPDAAETVPMLAGCLEKAEEFEIREAAAFALGWIGGEDAVAPLVRASVEESPTVRLAAVTALARVTPRTSNVLAALVAAARDEKEEIRKIARGAFDE